jgi:glycosyltransferase involved in cell wall biosynthesis
MTALPLKQKISVVVLTKNEEKNIAACLESVKWADEIIVIDDHSTDKTADIAKRYTGNVIMHSLSSNFSEQRNLGLDRASGDWILQMDADERVTDELRKKITDILKNGSELSAFRFKRTNNFCGKFLTAGGEDTHRPLRLFKKAGARFSGDRIHEQLTVNGRIGEIDSVMEHYNFPDISHYVETQDFYSGLEARALYEKAGLIPERRLRKELTIGPVKLFFKIYIKRRGYRDGLHGLVFAALSAWRRFLIYAKYWELNQSSYKTGGMK